MGSSSNTIGWGRCLLAAEIESSGLWKTFGGHVLIYVHKEKALADVERVYPAKHYVMVDDKLRILDAVKNKWRDRVTTVFPKQGHYAKDDKILAEQPPADISLSHIGALLNHKRSDFLSA